MNIFKKAFQGGDIKVKGLMAWGTYKGFHVAAEQNAQTYAFNVRITYHKEGSENDALMLKDHLNELFGRIKAEQKQLADYIVEDNVIKFTVNSAGLAAATAKKINSNADQIIALLQAEGCGSGCEQCGSEYSVHIYNVNNTARYLCDNCKQQLEQDMESARDEVKNQKSNVVLGIVGAVGGSLLGVVLWVLIYQLGYIAGIAGAAIMLLGMFGYRKFGGVLDTKGVIISVVIALVMVFEASHISWTIEAMKAYHEYLQIDMDFFYMYRRLFSILEKLDVTSDFIGELVIGYGLSLLVGISPIIAAFRESRGGYKMKLLQ